MKYLQLNKFKKILTITLIMVGTYLFSQTIDLFKSQRNGNHLILNQEKLNDVLIQSYDTVNIVIPNNNKVGTFDTLRLNKQNSISKKMKITLNENEPYENRNIAFYYSGYLNHDQSTFASLTYSKDLGVDIYIQEINSERLIYKSQEEYQYEEKNIPLKKEGKSFRQSIDNNNFCSDLEEYKNPGLKDLTPMDYIAVSRSVDKKVRVFIECGYDIYKNKGSVSNVVNFVKGIFSNVSQLYKNDGIYLELSEIKVWDKPDPYNSSNMDWKLKSFSNNRTNYNGDVALLIDMRSNGGLAWIGGLCNSYYSHGYAGIHSTYSNLPTFSWTVSVVAHELGHVLGSPHTQSCSWPNGPIDGCVNVEDGRCNRGPIPQDGGTIMSYCHLTNVGVNFNKGFGHYPKRKIQYYINAAECLEVYEGDEDPNDPVDELLPPSNLENTCVSNNKWKVKWSKVEGAASYEIQVWRNYWHTIKETPNTFATIEGLQNFRPNQTYYWRVRAKNSSTVSNFTNQKSVTLTENDNCKEQEPLTPPQYIRSRDITDRSWVGYWPSVNNASHYEVQLWRGYWYTYANTTNNYVAFQGLSGFTPGATLYWRVRSKNQFEVSKFTEQAWTRLADRNSLNLSGEIDLANKLSIFPNPVKDYLYVKGIDTKTPFVIYDVYGREVLKGNTGIEGSINVQSLVSGAYFITMITSQEKLKTKFIKN